MRFKAILIIELIVISLFFKVNFSYASAQVTPASGQNEILVDNSDLDNGSFSTTVFGGTGNVGEGFTKAGLKYIPEASHWVCQVDVRINNHNSPTDSVLMKIYSGGSDVDTGTLLATSNQVTSTAITSSAGWVSFWIGTPTVPGSCIGMGSGGTYWFTFSRTGSNNGTNNYNLGLKNTNPIPNVITSYVKGGGLITGSTPDAILQITGIKDGSAITLGTINPCADNLLFSVCSLLYLLFIPNFTNISTRVASTSATLNSKVPFSYFNSLSGINLSSVGTPDASLTLPIHTGSGSSALNFDIPFFATASANISGFFSAVKLSTTFIFWLGFLAYLYFLIRRVTTT
jgi:hypothetical protein